MKKNPGKFRLCCHITSKFVATNNEVFKILKDIVDFYLRYKKNRNTMQIQTNYIKWGLSQKIKKHFQYLHLVKKILCLELFFF
jgi:hypothetical protein